MPSLKGKSKGRDARQSRSRNTTPSNAGSGTGAVASATSYLENDVSKLIDQANGQYTDMLDLIAGPNIPDSRTLETLVDHLKSLSEMADIRGDTCNAGMREMSQKRKNVTEDPELSREVGERAKLKRETEEDDEQIHKGKTKKRKERAAKEERPLSHGAHEVARQDGAETKVEGGKCSSWPRHTPHPPTAPPSIFPFAKMTDHTQRLLQSPSIRRTPALMTVPPFHLHPCCLPTVPLPGQMARPRLGLPARIPAKTLTSLNPSPPYLKSRFSEKTRSSSMIRPFTISET